MNTQELLESLGMPALISSVGLYLIKRYFDNADKKKEISKENSERIGEVEEALKDLQTKEKRTKEIVEDLNLALQIILKDRIIQQYNLYNAKGYFPIYARESMQIMYTQYSKIYKNNSLDELVESLYRLPVEKDAE